MGNKSCKGCGAPIKGDKCDYCSNINIESDIILTITGKMNNIVFKKGEGQNRNILIEGKMENYTFKTNKRVAILLFGKMNSIYMENIEYSLIENKGKMNNIYSK